MKEKWIVLFLSQLVLNQKQRLHFLFLVCRFLKIYEHSSFLTSLKTRLVIFYSKKKRRKQQPPAQHYMVHHLPEQGKREKKRLLWQKQQFYLFNFSVSVLFVLPFCFFFFREKLDKLGQGKTESKFYFRTYFFSSASSSYR